MNDAQERMRHTLSLGRLFDIRVGVHVSWLAVFAFMVVSIAGGIDGVPRPAAYGFAAVCALLLFASVIAHEFAHALVARRFGVETRSIILFLFGGVATLECEPPTPRAEVTIALAGPAMSAVLAGAAFAGVATVERLASGGSAQAAGLICAYLALANGVLAVFNLVPAFPMDGGRVLRAAIWRARKSRAAATGAASIVGLVLAVALVAGGTAAVIAQHAWRDVWYVMIGGFLVYQGCRQLRESRLVERLERLCVGDLMEAAPLGAEFGLDDFALAPSATAFDAVSAFRSSARTQIAVVDAGQLAGWLRREPTLAMLDPAA